ncbi:MAG TPA: ABC transporter permease [Vicinamibacterales bacterium]|nr:ABC transporter permease [Vicinamibacterales bacterium]
MKRLATSIFVAALHLYPASFRDEYAGEMRRVFADSLRNALGPLDAVLVCLHAIGGVLVEAPREHGDLVLNDLRYAFRTLRKARWFTATALITLALGIGTNTAIFSVVEAVLLRQLPYDHPDRLVMVWVRNPEQGFDHDLTSYPRLADWRTDSTTIEAFAAYSTATHVLTGSEYPEQVRSARVTGNFFQVMGARPLAGTAFSSGDDAFGAPRKAILSHGLWARRFGADPRIVGRAITLDGHPYTVVGVMPSSFVYPARDIDLWEPLAPDADLRAARSTFWLWTVARLKSGVTLAQAQGEMDALSRRLAAQYVGDRSLGVSLVDLQDELTATVRPALFVLEGAVLLVLLIACANVAGMLIARASEREREIALREALGAGRGRVIRQLLTEVMVLFGIGGAIGLALGAGLVRAVVRLAPPALPQLRDVHVNWTVAVYAVVVTALTALLFGAVPAIQATRRGRADLIRGGSRISGHRGAAWIRTGLLAVQVALAFVLLTGAGLLLRSFAHMQAVDLGFDPDQMVVGHVSLPPAKYDAGAKSVTFFESLTDRLRAVPGIQSAAGATSLLLSRLPVSGDFQIEGRAEAIRTPLTYDAVTPGFFRAMRIPLLRGRYFTDADGAHAERVTIVNDTTAKKYWPAGNAIGRRIRFGATSPWMRIVGVVADTKRGGIDAPVFTESYEPLRQVAPLNLWIVVRTTTNAPANAVQALEDAVRAIDPQQPVSRMGSLHALLDETIASRRLNTVLVAIFAAIALMLAAVGVYGLLSYVIAQQHHDIGIRLALGASRQDIIAATGARAMAAAGVGAAGGIMLSVAVRRVIHTLLFGVSPVDRATYAAAVLMLAGVVMAAAFVPLKRALRVDPVESLRAD